jgi:hypothetical protein
MIIKIGNPVLFMGDDYCRKYGGVFIHLVRFNFNIYRNAKGEIWVNNTRIIK